MNRLFIKGHESTNSSFEETYGNILMSLQAFSDRGEVFILRLVNLVRLNAYTYEEYDNTTQNRLQLGLTTFHKRA